MKLWNSAVVCLTLASCTALPPSSPTAAPARSVAAARPDRAAALVEEGAAQALAAGERRYRVSLSGPTPSHSALDAAVRRAVAQGGEGTWFLREWTWTTEESAGKSVLTVDFRYASDGQTPDLLGAARARADAVASQLLRPGQSDFEKEAAIHDWIVDHTAYDEAGYRTGTVPEAGYTPFGVLVRGSAVCEGYATTFVMLASRMGLEARLVTGVAGGGGHSWNQVKVDGRWYNLDVTWDDPVGGPQRRLYSYFNVTDELLSRSHRWDRGSAEACTSTEADWFRQNGLDVGSVRDLRSRTVEALDRKLPAFRGRLLGAGSDRIEAELKAALEAAVRNTRNLRSYSFSADDDTGAFEATFTYR